MRFLKPLEIGLMFWASESAEATLGELRSFGLNAGQLGIPGDFAIPADATSWRQAIAETDAAIVTAVCSFSGESYADIATVGQTVGLVPPATRQERIARIITVSDFAAALDIPSVACHIGFIDSAYDAVKDAVGEICDRCAVRSQTFALETGQESAAALLQFIEDVARPNLRINFDPANLILYGTGNPLEALNLLAPYIVSVHCKDGDPPPADTPGALGTERRLGDGGVDLRRFIGQLRAGGYKGILSIEREEPDPELRKTDIHHAIGLLKELSD